LNIIQETLNEGRTAMSRGRLRGKAQATRLNALFAALADPTRRAIIEQLARGEARVTEVAEPFAMSLNAVSKHILVLEDIGLVRRRVAGRDHYLTFESRPLDDAYGWIERARKFWNTRLDEMERLLREQAATGGDTRAK
jgi:DNA-binding transcriptional ArsR family regulator